MTPFDDILTLDGAFALAEGADVFSDTVTQFAGVLADAMGGERAGAFANTAGQIITDTVGASGWATGATAGEAIVDATASGDRVMKVSRPLGRSADETTASQAIAVTNVSTTIIGIDSSLET